MIVSYTEQPVMLAGGEVVSLRRPTYRIAELGYGPLDPRTMMSPRLTPQMIGLGLLEAIPEAAILARVGRSISRSRLRTDSAQPTHGSAARSTARLRSRNWPFRSARSRLRAGGSRPGRAGATAAGAGSVGSVFMAFSPHMVQMDHIWL